MNNFNFSDQYRACTIFWLYVLKCFATMDGNRPCFHINGKVHSNCASTNSILSNSLYTHVYVFPLYLKGKMHFWPPLVLQEPPEGAGLPFGFDTPQPLTVVVRRMGSRSAENIMPKNNFKISFQDMNCDVVD